MNQLMDFGGEKNELHNMGWDAGQGGFSEGDSASHIKELCFPPNHLCFEIIQNELQSLLQGF